MVVFYDIIFIIQHYCIYGNKEPVDTMVPKHDIGSGEYQQLNDDPLTQNR